MDAERHILIVDDDRLWREALALRVRELGGAATAVGSVAEAIDELERARVDLVLTDREMPGASGLDLVAYVRTRRPGTPVVVMSGAVDEELRRAADAGGAASVRAKGTLLAEVDEIVDLDVAAAA